MVNSYEYERRHCIEGVEFYRVFFELDFTCLGNEVRVNCLSFSSINVVIANNDNNESGLVCGEMGS